jgi:hypothetical protein
MLPLPLVWLLCGLPLLLMAVLLLLQRWVAGFTGMRFWSHPIEPDSRRLQQPSPVRLLAGAQRLLRAHAAAAAAAEDKRGGKGGALSWGKLNIQQLIARDPGMLLVRAVKALLMECECCVATSGCFVCKCTVVHTLNCKHD